MSDSSAGTCGWCWRNCGPMLSSRTAYTNSLPNSWAKDSAPNIFHSNSHQTLSVVKSKPPPHPPLLNHKIKRLKGRALLLIHTTPISVPIQVCSFFNTPPLPSLIFITAAFIWFLKVLGWDIQILTGIAWRKLTSSWLKQSQIIWSGWGSSWFPEMLAPSLGVPQPLRAFKAVGV